MASGFGRRSPKNGLKKHANAMERSGPVTEMVILGNA